jgi:hypothetical protein
MRSANFSKHKSRIYYNGPFAFLLELECSLCEGEKERKNEFF